jgi:hypothetical protein
VLLIVANIFNLIIAHVDKPFLQNQRPVWYEWHRSIEFKQPCWPDEFKKYESVHHQGFNADWLFVSLSAVSQRIPPDSDLIVLSRKSQDDLEKLGFVDASLSLTEYRYGAPFTTRRTHSALVTIVGTDYRRAWPDPEDEKRFHVTYSLAGLILNPIIYALPIWLIVMGFRWALITRRSRKRARLGLCVGCSYELAGLGVCPECGRSRV